MPHHAMNRTRSLYFVTSLTLARVPLVFAFFIGALVNSWMATPPSWLFPFCVACIAMAAITDLFDGYFARKLEVTTTLGAYADPFTDKVFYLTTLPLLVFIAAKNGHMAHSTVLACFTVQFLFRDQWVSFMRSIGSLHNASAKANWSGKLRTAINFPLICVVYLFEESPVHFANMQIIYTLEAVGLGINMVSIYIYSRYYWPYLKKSVQPDAAENGDQ
jgi:CDP-diacylglycerol--glycerol-3-phosphate 3-phosphatidyltransferase